jgi:hypothetical protein
VATSARPIIIVFDNSLSIENNDGMATLQLSPGLLTLRLTRGEKIAGLLRDLEVPLSAVRAVEVVDEPLRGMTGLRAPGLALPGLRKIGTWRSRGGRTLVCVRKDQPAVRVRLEGARFDVLLVGTDDAAAVAVAITAALSPAA